MIYTSSAPQGCASPARAVGTARLGLGLHVCLPMGKADPTRYVLFLTSKIMGILRKSSLHIHCNLLEDSG